jgi:tetratricopeptide (TPR) repeat protein
LTDRSEDEVESALEGALGAGLLSDSSGESFAFTHSLIRDALYRELSSHRKRRLHQCIAESLESLQPPEVESRSAEIAAHLLNAGQPERAAPYLLEAAKQALVVGALERAQEYAEESLQIALDRDSLSLENVSRLRLAVILRMRGRRSDALEQLENALTGYRLTNDIDGLLHVFGEMALLFPVHETPGEIADRIDRFLGQLNSISDRQDFLARYFSLLLALGKSSFPAGRLEDGLVAARQAQHLTRIYQADEKDVLTADACTAFFLLTSGRVNEARDAYADVWREAEERLRRAAEVAMIPQAGRDYPRPVYVPSCTLSSDYLLPLAQLNLRLGKWAEARSLLRQFLAMVAEHPNPKEHLEVQASHGLLPLDRPRSSLGIEHSREVENVLAELDILEGCPENAIRRLEPLLDRNDVEEFNVTWLLPVLSWAYVVIGDATAGELLERSIERTRRQGHVISLANLLWVSGMYLKDQARWTEAEDALREAIDLARRIQYPYAEGRARYELAALYGSLGKADRARVELRKAGSIFELLGAARDTERVKAALANLVAPDRRSRPVRAPEVSLRVPPSSTRD